MELFGMPVPADQIETVAAAGAGALSSTLANRSADSLRRRAADTLAGLFAAAFLGPAIAERIGGSDKVFCGVVFLTGVVGAIVVNSIWERMKTGNWAEWLKSLLSRGG